MLCKGESHFGKSESIKRDTMNRSVEELFFFQEGCSGSIYGQILLFVKR